MEKQLTDNEIMNAIDKLCIKLIADSPSKRKDCCKHKSHSRDRYCNASTHTNCNRCRYFSPTVFGKLKTVYIYCENMKSDLEKIRVDNSNLNAEIERLQLRITRMAEDYDMLRGELDYYREENDNGQDGNRQELESNQDSKTDDKGKPWGKNQSGNKHNSEA